MTAAVQARSLTITVNGNDWSQNLVSFEIGFESYQQGTGLILKKGTLVLCNIRGDSRAIDPIDQNDFAVGNTVSVKLPGSVAHPLGNSLKILAPPEVSPINSGIPEVEGNLIVSIPVGCNLAYFRTKQSDEDKTGVTLGSAIAINTVIQNLLEAGEVPSADINLSLSSNVEIDYPFAKNGNGFVDFAGEITYSSYYNGTTTNPRVLYCDSSNTVRNFDIILPKAQSYTGNIVTLGISDRLYQRQLDLSSGAGIFKVVGVKRIVKNASEDYPFTDVTINYEGGLEVSRVETTYNVEEGSLTGQDYWEANYPQYPFPGYSTYSFTVQPYYYNFASTLFMAANIFRNPFVQIREGSPGLITPIGTRFSSTRTKLFERRQYDDDKESIFQVKDNLEMFAYDGENRLFRTWEITTGVSIDLYPNPEIWNTGAPAGIDDRVVGAVRNQRFFLCPQELIYTEYEFSVDSIISKKRQDVYQNLAILDRNASIQDLFQLTEYGSVIRNINNWYQKSETIDKWTKRDDRYTLETTSRVAAIVNNPTLTGTIAERTKLQYPARTVSRIRDQEPPATQYFDGTISIKENQIWANTVFGNGANPKTIDLQIPFLFNDYANEPTEESDQPSQFGKIEGEIINGRQFQYLIECHPSIFESVTSPLVGATVIEPSQKRYFLMDALTWYHTATETYVAGAGIYAGSSSLVGTAPDIYPTQLIATPTPTGTIAVAGVAFRDTITGSAYR